MPGSECPVGDWLSLKLPYRTGQLEIGHGLRWLLEPFAFESTLNAFEMRVRPGSEQLLNTGQQLAVGHGMAFVSKTCAGLTAAPGQVVRARRIANNRNPARDSSLYSGAVIPAGSFETKQ
jgi:hypothetical protein